MRSFSVSDLTTNKEKIVSLFQEKTGLPKDYVMNLYENYEHNFYGEENKEQLIVDAFSKLVSDDLEDYNSLVNEINYRFETESFEDIHASIIELLKNSNCSDITLYQVINYLLSLKNNNFEFEVNKKNSELFESVGISVKINDEQPVINGYTNVDSSVNIPFYNDLRSLLSSRNVSYLRGIMSAHQIIDKWLSHEIVELSNKDAITTVDNNQMQMIYQQLINGELSPMYRNVSVLRTLIADLQTFGFDLMCLVNRYVVSNQDNIRYVNKQKVISFKKATSRLCKEWDSSAKSSILLQGGTDINDLKFDTVEENSNISYPYINIDAYVARDCLYILKDISNDFNLKIRPIISNFITHSFEIIYSLERINQQKNGVKYSED